MLFVKRGALFYYFIGINALNIVMNYYILLTKPEDELYVDETAESVRHTDPDAVINVIKQDQLRAAVMEATGDYICIVKPGVAVTGLYTTEHHLTGTTLHNTFTLNTKYFCVSVEALKAVITEAYSLEDLPYLLEKRGYSTQLLQPIEGKTVRNCAFESSFYGSVDLIKVPLLFIDCNDGHYLTGYQNSYLSEAAAVNRALAFINRHK